MRVICKPRQAGKTTELIKIASETLSYIVCPNKLRVTKIMERAQDLGLDILTPLTFAEFLEGKYYGRGISRIIIDDVDLLLMNLAKGLRIEAISITDNDQEYSN